MADINEIDKLKRMVDMGMIPQEAMDGYLQGVAEREMERRKRELEQEIVRRKSEYEQQYGDYVPVPYYPRATSSGGTSLTEEELNRMVEKLYPQPMDRDAFEKWRKGGMPFEPWKLDPWDTDELEREREKLREAERVAKEKARKAAAEARARKKAERLARMLERMLGYYEIQTEEAKDKRLG